MQSVRSFVGLRVASVSAISFTLFLNQSKYFCDATITNNLPARNEPVIYQYKICPFCHRTKAYLDYLQIKYKTVEVNPLTKSEISFTPADKKKVPIFIIDGQTIHDSNNIIEYISSNLAKDSFRGVSRKNFITEDTNKWNEWSEKKLAVMLYPNITRSFSECWECFGYSTEVESWSTFERYVVRVMGTLFMGFANGQIKKKHGIVKEREELHALLLDWTGALGSNKYLHGDHPSLPDVLVFGVLGSIAETATFREIMTNNSKLERWFANMTLLYQTQDPK
jgi:microsomal prostaglandin-E synthase 2